MRAGWTQAQGGRVGGGGGGGGGGIGWHAGGGAQWPAVDSSSLISAIFVLTCKL